MLLFSPCRRRFLMLMPATMLMPLPARPCSLLFAAVVAFMLCCCQPPLSLLLLTLAGDDTRQSCFFASYAAPLPLIDACRLRHDCYALLLSRCFDMRADTMFLPILLMSRGQLLRRRHADTMPAAIMRCFHRCH